MASTETLTHTPNPLYLARHRQDDLEALYDTLPAAAAGELDGDYTGTLLGFTGLNRAPGLVKAGLYRLLGTRLNPWFGKRFSGAEGANLWGVPGGQRPWGYYRIADSKLAHALTLDYNHPANPGLLRPILGEVRRLQPGLYLARMRYRSNNSAVTVLFFTLQEQQGCR